MHKLLNLSMTDFTVVWLNGECRITHKDSGAMGRGKEKSVAYKRLINTTTFSKWIKSEVYSHIGENK